MLGGMRRSSGCPPLASDASARLRRVELVRPGSSSLARLTVLSTTEAQRQDREIEERGRWAPPTVDAAAAIDQAAAMVDRFNRLFMRTLRSLRDLRRYSASVVVQNVGQLNVG